MVATRSPARSVPGVGPVSALIPAVARTHRALAARLLADAGVYPGQERTLMLLWQADGRTQAELARCLGITGPTMAKGLERLQRNGFLTRRRSETDARTVIVSLTAKGRDLEARVQGIWADLERHTTAGLNGPERRTLVYLLGRVSDALSAAPPAEPSRTVP